MVFHMYFLQYYSDDLGVALSFMLFDMKNNADFDMKNNADLYYGFIMHIV